MVWGLVGIYRLWSGATGRVFHQVGSPFPLARSLIQKSTTSQLVTAITEYANHVLVTSSQVPRLGTDFFNGGITKMGPVQTDTGALPLWRLATNDVRLDNRRKTGDAPAALLFTAGA